MKFEEAKEYAVNHPDYLYLSGSRLYGTNRPESDVDLRGFVWPPYEALLGIRTFNVEELEGDHKVFSVKRFLTLVLSGDPQLIEGFFVDGESVHACSNLARRILALKNDIVSNIIFYRISGYGYSEWRKARGEKLVIDARTPTQEQLVHDLRNVCPHLDKEEMDTIISMIERDNSRHIVPAKNKIGAKRANEFEDYGYGVSCASHSIRLMSQLKELLLTGGITFPRPEAPLLIKIRKGEVPLSEAQEVFEQVQSEAGDAKGQSVLPEKPNHKKVWAEYEKMVAEQIFSDERFLSVAGVSKTV